VVTWDTTHISMLIGNAVHAGAEFGRQHMMDNQKFQMAEVVNRALEAYNEDIAKQKGQILFENSNVANLEEGAKEVAGLVRAVVTKLLPTEVGEKRIVAIERKLNFTGIFGFQFYARIDAQAVDGTIKDLKTSSKDLDWWMRFQLLCYGLPDYCANPQNPKLDPIQIDQVKKDDDFRIFSVPFQPTAEDYEEARNLVLKTFDAIQLLRLHNPRPGYKCQVKHPTLGDQAVELKAVRGFEYLLPARSKKLEGEPGAMATALDLTDLEAVAALAAEQEEEVADELSLV